MRRISEIPLGYRVGAAVAAGLGFAGAVAGCTPGRETAPQIPKGAIICPADTSYSSGNTLTERFKCPTGGIVVILSSENDGRPDVNFQQNGKTIPGGELPNGATQGSVPIPNTTWNAEVAGINQYWEPWPVGNVYSAQTVYLSTAA